MEEDFYFEEDADLLNEETFGVDVDTDFNDDWEVQHEKVSKFFEIEHENVKKYSPLKVPTKEHLKECYEGVQNEDEEDVIIGNSISQLGLDDDKDDKDFIIKDTHHSQSIEFLESKESWMSPPRLKSRNSLDELISPGDGIWASPSREALEGEQDFPDMQRKEGEDIIKKLFGGHNIVTGRRGDHAPVTNVIHAKDLENGFKPTDKRNTPANLARTHLPGGTQLPYSLKMSPFDTATIPENPLNGLESTLKMRSPYPYSVEKFNISPLMMMNRPFMQLGGFRSPGMIEIFPPPVLSPHIMAQNPFLHDLVGMHLYNSPYQWRNHNGREGSLYHNTPRNSRTWQKYNDSDLKEEDIFMKMEPSKLMTAKEKEWIFKISLMSLLCGDSNISDFYFISYMEHKQIKKSHQDKETNKSSSDEEILCENLEKTKQLMSYTNKQQHPKESYKTVKFEGSLGKLSITSVHHPRQIMDVGNSEQESQILTKMPELGRKKFAMFGLIEKMYSIYLSLSDLARSLLNSAPEKQEIILHERQEKITHIFRMMKIGLHNTDQESDAEHFLNLMSISKARKLLPRVFLLFNQEQSESIVVALIHFLPALLKKDSKEQVLLSLVEKIRIVVMKSNETFKIKCIHLLRKVNLKIILSYQFSLQFLTVILKSFTICESAVNLDWIYYEVEVPKVIKELENDVAIRNKSDILSLKVLLGIEELLIEIEE